MEKHSISELDKLKLIYYEILDGYSYNSECNLYFKHFTESESHLLLQRKIELCNFYKKEGVPTELELLKNALESGEWTQVKENKILELKYLITDNEKLIQDIIPQQRAGIEGIIASKKKELYELQSDRKSTLGKCIEDLVDEDIDDYITFLMTYKDSNLTIHLENSYDIFETWDIEEAKNITLYLNNAYQKFSEENLEYIASMPFFLNKLSFCKDNIKQFMGKPIYKISHNQNYILSLGVKNLNILSRAKGNPPNLNLDATPKQVAHWYKMQYGIQMAEANQAKSVNSGGNTQRWNF